MGLAIAALYFLTAVCYTNDIYFCHPIYQYGFLQIAEESEWFMPEQGIVILGIVINTVGYSLGRAFIYSTPEYAVMKLPYQILEDVVGSVLGYVLCFACGIKKLFEREFGSRKNKKTN